MKIFISLCMQMLFFAPSAFTQSPRFEVLSATDQHWYKGNTHAHTIESDGDSPADTVISWYKRHGYNFLVISDHNVFVDPARFTSFVDSNFLLITGEELTTSFEKKPVHVNGLNIPGLIKPRTDSTLLGTVQKNVDAVRDVEGVPHINHPNYQWALNADILAHVQNDKLLEIFNGHPLVNNHGGGGSPGMEEVWDILLTGGKRMYGIAVDDAHHFKEEFAADRSNPGRGWVVVRAKSLNVKDILASMEAGQFYASTGVELDNITMSSTQMEIRIRPKGTFKYTTEFIGDGGRILYKTFSNPAMYTLTGGTKYVRARVTDSGGFIAWIQPAFVIH